MREAVAARLRVIPRTAARRRRGRRGLAAVCAAAALTLLASACGSGGSATVTGTTPADGGTATWAEAAANWPDFIFPFSPPDNFSITNFNYFQYLMYRPLYWFGNKTQPTLNPALSLADPPVYHGQHVTIHLKNSYKWADGTTVSAQNVVFWMHMMQAEKLNWGGYVPGAFPDNVADVKAVDPTTVTMRITKPYSPLWFTDNELSQLTPMPKTWDITGPDQASDCTEVVADCAAVYQYLIKQAEDTSTYATSKLWADVDGPWKLASFAVDGPVKFDLNPSYGGPLPPHHISHFEEVPFTTEQAEYNVMQAGGSQTLDVGYLPTVDAPVPPAGESVGENPLDGYNLKPLYSWGLNYAPFNFNNTQVGPVFRQLYFRQAMQYLMDQEGVVSGPLHGYGVVSVGQVGVVPTTPYLSAQIRTGDKYALNPTAASALLRQNGWTVNPGKQTTCTSPGIGAGQCGKGIRAGEGLTFNLDYDSGTSWVASEVRELVSNAAEVGITINATPASFNQVITETGANKWQILDWGNGWSYSPDYLPTGEELFATGSAANFGHYSDPTNDALIQASLRAPNATTFYRALHKWEDYLENQIPVLMQPQGVFELTETRDGLVAPPQTPTLMLTPEDWYFVK